MQTTKKYEEDWLEREFIGYGFETPDPNWPKSAKVCVSFVVQYYMGAELNVLEGDEIACPDLLEIPPRAVVRGRSEPAEEMYAYGAREGVPRLLDLFKRQQVPVTWNIYTRALEKAPYWVKPIIDSGAEMSCGGHRYRDNFYLDPETQDREIQQSIDVLQKLTGDKTLPKGWLVEKRSNISTKLYSLAHKAKDLPLLYSSDSCSDDLPYWNYTKDSEQGLLMIPFSYDCSDIRFNVRGSGWATPRDYFLHLKDTFDCFEMEANAGHAKMMTVLLHPHIIGRPNRTYWLHQFIQYAQSKNAWIARRMDIAEHWKSRFPYEPETAFGQTKVPDCGHISI